MICKYCGETKEETDFEVANTVNDKVYRRRKCKSCKRETQNKRKSKQREWLREYKKKLSCVRCGFNDWRCLDFHHKGDKDNEVSNMIGLSKKRILDEISKCEVVCANCHRIIHFEEKNGM
jgi:hypothetical protein